MKSSLGPVKALATAGTLLTTTRSGTMLFSKPNCVNPIVRILSSFTTTLQVSQVLTCNVVVNLQSNIPLEYVIVPSERSIAWRSVFGLTARWSGW